MANVEDTAIRLARDVYQSILESVIPQPLMESVGKAIVSETKWEKLSAQQKIALFRVASILEAKLNAEVPEVVASVETVRNKETGEISRRVTLGPDKAKESAEPTDKTELVTQALAEEK